jgi:urease accessory protein
MPTRSFNSFSLRFAICGLTVLTLLILCAPVMAHHPFGGDAPVNIFEGFLSGIGHPVIGLDHLAFVITAGLLATTFNRGWFIPIVFVLASLTGTIIHLLNFNLPMTEFLISLSVLGFGLLLAMKDSLPEAAVIVLAGMAGLFHGYAYGESVIGAGMPSLIAYLIGFSTIQMVISGGVYLVAKKLVSSDDNVKPLSLRFAGFILSGVGVTLLSNLLLG